MAKVDCTVEETELTNEDDRQQPGVLVICGRCGHQVERFGTSSKSIRRCLMLLKEEGPEDESNDYVAEGSDD